MYQHYLILCAVSGVVFGNSHEAKYIDLLPEEEKQEFLNRIARRIIEEIQSKDSPEQSHVEVSDDQLNAHHDYVRDLINEESKNMRNEKRENSKENLEEIHDFDLKKDIVADGYNNQEINEKGQYIDLTLRNNIDKNNKEKKVFNDTTYNAIPVKVIYDENETMIAHESTNNSKLADVLDISDSDQKNIINKHVSSNFDNTTVQRENLSLDLDKYSKESENIKQSSSKNIRNYSQELEIKEKISDNSAAYSTKPKFNTDTTVVKGYTNVNNTNADSLDNEDIFTNNGIDSDKITVNEESSTSENELTNKYTSLPPFTLELNTNSDSKNSERNEMQSSTIYVTTIKSTSENLNKESEDKNNSNIARSNVETDEIKLGTNIEGNIVKTQLRKRIEDHSHEDTIQKSFHNKNNKPRQQKNKPFKQLFVYEIPKETSVFVKPADLKENEQQPYVVPVYNFEPKNAYYNAYNRFGPNNNEGVEVIKTNTIENNEEVLDKESYLRSGFKIELNRKKINEKKGRHTYITKQAHHPHWIHIINEMFENNSKNSKTLKGLGVVNKRGNSFLQINPYHQYENNRLITSKTSPNLKNLQLVQHTDNVVETRRRTNKKFRHVGRNLPSSSEIDHPYNSIHKFNMKNHMRAVKNLFYKQQKFGFLAPSPYTTVEPRHKRDFDGGYGLHFNNEDRKLKKKPEIKNIAVDYYFGRYKTKNRTDEDFDDEYSEIDDIKSITQQNINVLKNNREKIHLKHYRMIAEDSCEEGCIEMDLNIPGRHLENYLNINIKVLKDMIYRDNMDLVSYDWLLSTVDMESALKKLIYLIKSIEKGIFVDPLDLKLLNYILDIYEQSKNTLENTMYSKKQSNAIQDIKYIVNSFLNLLRRRILLPKNKNKKAGEKIKNPIQLWYRYYIRDGLINQKQAGKTRLMKSFKKLLMDLEDNMFDLHNALKQIALITTYGDQNWYADLKNVYLKSATRKQLLQVILHLAASRLFSSIEGTAKNAEEDNLYIKRNEDVLRKIRDEFVFVVKILEQIKKIDFVSNLRV